MINIEVKHKSQMKNVPEIEEAIESAEKRLAGKGRILVRPSGTEPKIRVMVEGKDQKLIHKISAGVAKTIKKVLG